MDTFIELEKNLTLPNLFYLFSVLVTLDIITGMIKAWKNNSFKSRTLRNGLFTSLGEFILLITCIGISTFIEVSKLPIYSILLFMVLKELSSIIENLVEIGVRLPKWLIVGLKAYSDKLDESGVHKK